MVEWSKAFLPFLWGVMQNKKKKIFKKKGSQADHKFGMQGLDARVGEKWPLVNLMDDYRL